MFRAYDKATGDVVGELELPGGTTAAPITYMVDGKQYILVTVGWEEIRQEVDTGDDRRHRKPALALVVREPGMHAPHSPPKLQDWRCAAAIQTSRRECADWRRS